MALLWAQLRDITGGQELTPADNKEQQIIRHLLTDSRLQKSAEGTVFFAIRGKQNGHQFVRELYKKGVRLFIIEEKMDLTPYEGAQVLLVPHSIRALQLIAAYHRQSLGLKTIAITGSNGKTTVKEWLSAMLATEISLIKTPRSYNSQIGVPLSVWNANESHELGVFEAGISLPGEMTHLQRVLDPSIGIFTSIGPAHAAGFESLQQKVAEKALLFKNAEVIICCRDHKDSYAHLSATYGERLLDWSRSDNQATILVSQVGERLQLRSKHYEYRFTIPFKLDIWTENCLHAIVTALHLGVDPAHIQEAIDYLQPVKMRLTIKKGKKGCYLIDDTYNNDLNGLEVALDYLKLQKQREKKTVILSEFLDVGMYERQIVERLKELISTQEVSRLLLIGSWTSTLFDHWPIDVAIFSSKEAFLAQLPHFQDEMILIKGARVFAFEDIVHRLVEKSHRTHLEINFESLIHNLNVYRQHLQPQVKVLAMVKAFGYGGGGAEISNLLQFHNIDYLGVAYTDEAIQLRTNGVAKPIMVLNPDFERSAEMSAQGIEPEVYSLRTLNLIAAEEHPPAIHLKIETGMNRLGLVQEEWNTAANILQSNPQIRVAGIFTHLSSADDEEADDFSAKQIALFEEAYLFISTSIGYRPLKHAVNSSGIVRFPAYHFDMVRLGIGLYGFDPSHQLSLRPVSRLLTYVSQIKEVNPGDPIGYNREGFSDKKMTIAVLPIGYADGYDRRFGRGVGMVTWNGHLLPTIGNICMDMTMVDTLDFPTKEGDEIEIFGNHQDVSVLAKQINTIPYEILTSISERVVRVYQSE